MVRFSKFTLNIKIYKEFEGFLSKLVWRETLFSPQSHCSPTQLWNYSRAVGDHPPPPPSKTFEKKSTSVYINKKIFYFWL